MRQRRVPATSSYLLQVGKLSRDSLERIIPELALLLRELLPLLRELLLLLRERVARFGELLPRFAELALGLGEQSAERGVFVQAGVYGVHEDGRGYALRRTVEAAVGRVAASWTSLERHRARAGGAGRRRLRCAS